MGLEICGKCGRFHYVPGDCPPARSTAARKDVQAMGLREPVAVATKTGSNAEAVGVVGSPRAASPVSRFESGNQAGTQAPPVELIVGKRRGRPQTITDMKAYKAKKARERRAKAKSDRHHKS